VQALGSKPLHFTLHRVYVAACIDCAGCLLIDSCFFTDCRLPQCTDLPRGQLQQKLFFLQFIFVPRPFAGFTFFCGPSVRPCILEIYVMLCITEFLPNFFYQ